MNCGVVIGLVLLLVVVLLAYLFMSQATDLNPVGVLSDESESKTGIDFTESTFGIMILFNLSTYKKIFSSLKRKVNTLKISNVKGQGLSVSIIVVGVICLFAAVILVNLLLGSSNDTKDATTGVADSICADRGGTCTDVEGSEGGCPDGKTQLSPRCIGHPNRICCRN